jgi:hypothetical protein
MMLVGFLLRRLPPVLGFRLLLRLPELHARVPDPAPLRGGNPQSVSACLIASVADHPLGGVESLTVRIADVSDGVVRAGDGLLIEVTQ